MRILRGEEPKRGAAENLSERDGEKKMSKKQVLDIIDTLARSQGFYGRLGRDIRAAEVRGIDTSDFFAQFADCKDAVDVILKIES